MRTKVAWFLLFVVLFAAVSVSMVGVWRTMMRLGGSSPAGIAAPSWANPRRHLLPTWTPAEVAGPTYSSFSCVAAEWTCIVRRVCTTDGSVFSYYVPPNATYRVVPPNLIAGTRRRAVSEKLQFRTVEGNPPSREEGIWTDGITVFYRSAVPHNPGHIVGDDIFPVFYALLEFGLIDSSPVSVVETGLSSMTSLHARLFEQWKAITPNKVRLLKQLVSMSRRESKPLCFDAAISGFEKLGFSNRNTEGKGALWLLFRQLSLERWDLPSALSVELRKRPKIVLVEKSNKRHVLNRNELAASLAKEFPNADVMQIVLDTLPMREQVRIASEASVMIAVPGTSLFNAYLMPPGACLVTLCQVILGVSNCGNEKAVLWDYFAHLRLRTYTMYDQSDLVYHPEILKDLTEKERTAVLNGRINDAPIKEYWLYWGSTDVTVKPQRLLPLVHQCFEEPF